MVPPFFTDCMDRPRPGRTDPPGVHAMDRSVTTLPSPEKTRLVQLPTSLCNHKQFRRTMNRLLGGISEPGGVSVPGGVSMPRGIEISGSPSLCTQASLNLVPRLTSNQVITRILALESCREYLTATAVRPKKVSFSITT